MERFRNLHQEISLAEFPAAPGVMNSVAILRPFNRAEVAAAIKSFKRNTAAGPDGIRADRIKNDKKGEVTLVHLMNCWLMTGRVPDQMKRSRSILLPKEDPQSLDINHWRPLTISSVLLRLFTKLLAARMAKETPLNPRQRGFIKAAGCDENRSILRALIEHGKKAGGIGVAFLDLAKAFDTVPHDLLRAGLERFGACAKLIGLVQGLYQGNSTSFRTAGGETGQIEITAGVKQGDPLSPVLFNIALDPLFCLLGNVGKPFRAGEARLNALGYADDTALVSENRGDLQYNLDLAGSYFRKVGLTLNVRKSHAFVISCSRKSFVVNNCLQLTVNGQKIPFVAPSHAVRYLGASVGGWGQQLDEGYSGLVKGCNGISRAPLKPMQKVNLMVRYLLPRLLYKEATNESLSVVKLRKLDREVRFRVKEWLKLPACTTNHFLYSAQKDGGLGLTQFASEVPGRVIARLETCLNSPDGTLREISAFLGFKARVERNAEKCHVALPLPKRRKAKTAAIEHKSWASLTLQGQGVSSMKGDAIGNAFLRESTFLKTKEVITAMRMRTNTVPTRVFAKTRSGGRGLGTVLCRHCGQTAETLGHISGYCPKTKKSRIRRHNLVVSEVQKIAVRGRFEVIREPRMFGDNGHAYIPDLILLKGEKGYIVDPTIVWERGDSLRKAAAVKKTKYKHLVGAVRDLQDQVEEVEILPLVIGARGVWPAKINNPLVDLLGIPRKTAKKWALLILCQTQKMVSEFMD